MSDNSKDKDFAPINVELSDRIPLASKRQSSPPQTNENTKSNMPMLVIAIVIALSACGASAYLYSLHQQNLASLATAEERIVRLENRLNATGEEMGNSTVALQVKVTELSARTEELWEQMDKLWASAWRRNQQEIKSLDGDLKGLQTNTNTLLKNMETKIANVSSGTQQLQNRIDGVNTKVGTQANDMLAINVNQDEMQSTITKQNTELRQMAEKLILLEKRNTSLLQQLQQIETKLTEVANKGV